MNILPINVYPSLGLPVLLIIYIKINGNKIRYFKQKQGFHLYISLIKISIFETLLIEVLLYL
jgi:hypothetical protein